MPDHDVMSRILVLETNDRHSQKHREILDDAIVSMSQDIRDIRDVIIGANLAKLPDRVSSLERKQWIGMGAASVLSSVGTYIASLILKR